MKRILSLFTIVSLVLQPFAYAQTTPVLDQALFQKEYSVNGGFELGTSKWTRYLDAAGAVPVDCVGGSPTVTLASSTTNPIQGKASGLITKPASNVQGQGYATTVTLDKAARTKMITVSGSYEVVSGTYSGGTGSTDSDLTVYLYDVTGAQVIQPSGYKLDGAVSGNTYPFAAIFQSPQYSTDTRDIRVCLHHATTSASAFSIRLDQVKVGVQNKSQGPPLTAETSYTPTFTGFGTVTVQNFRWFRDGEYLNVSGEFTSGTATAVEARISLPAGLVAASTYSNQSLVGDAARNSNSTTYFRDAVTIQPNSTYVNIGVQTSTTNLLNNALGNAIASSGSLLNINFRVKIQGWGSTVTMSDNSSSRIVTAQVFTSTSFTATSSTTYPTTGFSTQFDTHGAFSASTYTIPVPGYYEITGFATLATVTGNAIHAYKINGGANVFYGTGTNTGSSDRIGGAFKLGFLTAGTTVQFGVFSSVNATVNFFQVGITQVQGPSQIASSESVNASYYSTNGQSITATTDNLINFNTIVFDSHNAVTTGASWKFTAPISGVYEVKVANYVVLASATHYGTLFVNGVSNIRITEDIATATPALSVGSGLVKLKAGDFIDYRLNPSATTTLNTAAGLNYISITRVGN